MLAFLSGIYYYKKIGGRQALWLVYFLGATFCVEVISYYTEYVETVEFLKPLNETNYRDNYWLFNIFMIISAAFYTYYFRSTLRSKKLKLLLWGLLWVYVLGSIIYLLSTDILFVYYSPFTVIIGALLIMLSIAFFYLELLSSNLILEVNKTLPFYISVAVLIFYLCTTPLFIYSTYFSETSNPEFVDLSVQIMIITNTIMYSLYTIGFLVCSRKKKL